MEDACKDMVDKAPPHRFLLMWCTDGLEVLCDITAESQNRMWDALRGEKTQSRMPNLMHLELRARYNSQRFYEIYIIDVDAEVTEQDLREMFEQDPQTAADLIRKRGTCIFGEPRGRQRVVIN